MIRYLHKPMTCHLQWHITEKCNFRCKHCYLNDLYIKNELNGEQLFHVLDNWIDFIKKVNLDFAKISLTGGEPILKKEFWQLLERVSDYKQQGIINEICVMTNGSTLTDDIVRRYKDLDVNYIQISVEGTEKTNDEIRGEGSFQKAVRGARVIVAHGLPLSFSMTVTKQNVADIEPLARFAAEIGVGGMGVGRLIPQGRGKLMQDLMLSPRELLGLYRKLEEINAKFSRENIRLKVGLHCSDSLYTTINPNYRTHGCSTPYDVFTLLPNGDVIPCRRMPLVAGNILKNTFIEIYYARKIYQQLKNLENLDPRCKSCSYVYSCRGAGKCVANGWFGTPYSHDPQCWHVSEELAHEERKDRDYEKVKYSEHYAANVRTDLEPVDLNELEKDNIEIDLSSEVKPLIENSSRIHFRITESSLTEETGEKIIGFLNELEKKGTKVRIVKPLPPCIFGFNYKEIFRRYDIPATCTDCFRLFSLDENSVKLCNGKQGPELKYMNSREQIGEYFKLIQEKSKNLPVKCKGCRYNLRNQCQLVFCQR